MGRMFRILTDNGPEPSPHADPTEQGNPPTMNAYSPDPVPFVEVGGPDGVVSSHQGAGTRGQGPGKTWPKPAEAGPRATVSLAPAPAPLSPVLSVAFHKMPQVGLRIVPAGIAPEVVAYHHPDHPVSAEYRAVREEIRRQFDAPAQRTVLFTSGTPAAGTTTVALNVAVALAQDQAARVLVVDANADRPAVASRMGVADAPGLADVLAQSVPLAWAVQTTAVSGLHVLAGGVPTDRTAGQIPHELPRLLAQLRQWFDWVLVDVGVWDQTFGRDATVGAGDAVYLVTRHTDLERMEFHSLRGAVGPNLRGYITTRH